jgi:glycosyltransferase involved in cell wall biosynthesis
LSKTGAKYMDNLPLITIVIANYNYGQYINTAIDTALSQDYPGPLQICIVDDGSTDDSWEKIRILVDTDITKKDDLEIAEKVIVRPDLYEVRVIAIKRPNGGASVARNTAINHTWEETNAFAILDADDEYYPNKVSKMVRKMLEDPARIGVVYADYEIHDHNSGKIVREFKQPYNRNVLMNECIVHSNALISKRAFSSVKEERGFYDPNLHGPGGEEFIGCAEDYDLWIRISEQFMIVHIPESLAVANITGLNQTTNVNPEVFNKNWQYIMTKIQNRANGQE